MGQLMQAITASDVNEKLDLLQQILQNTGTANADGAKALMGNADDGGGGRTMTKLPPNGKQGVVPNVKQGYDGWMHEAYDANDPGKFTRPWFCWADALFAELVASLTSVDAPEDGATTSVAHTIPNYEPQDWFAQLHAGGAGARASLGDNADYGIGFGAGDDVGSSAYKCKERKGCMLDHLLDLRNSQGPAFLPKRNNAAAAASPTQAKHEKHKIAQDRERLMELVLGEDMLSSLRKTHRLPRPGLDDWESILEQQVGKARDDSRAAKRKRQSGFMGGDGEGKGEGEGFALYIWHAFVHVLYAVGVTGNDSGNIDGAMPTSEWRMHGKIISTEPADL
jgi:hypothetical protein